MASKFISFLFLFFLFLLLENRPTAHAGRPLPALVSEAPAIRIPNQGLKADESDSEMMEEGCNGVGEEECLMRRTLVANLDYVYTQKFHP